MADADNKGQRLCLSAIIIAVADQKKKLKAGQCR